MMKQRRQFNVKFVLVLGIGVLGLTLGGCHTIDGIGKDISSSSKFIQDSFDPAFDDGGVTEYEVNTQ